jgi:hypothetical protein
LALFVGAFAGPVASAAVGPGAAPGVESEAETVTFTGRGPEPLACVTMPDRDAVSIKAGSQVTLANNTGMTTHLDVPNHEPVVLADGEGVTLKLKIGTHLLKLVPDCLMAYGLPVQVEVGTGSGMREQPGPTTPPGVMDRPAGPTPTSQPGTAPPVAVADTTAPAVSGAAASAGPGVADSPGPTSSAAAPVALDGTEIEGPFPLIGHAGSRAARRLLAVIAAICVFGVTAGIIRAIVAQRSSNVVNT